MSEEPPTTKTLVQTLSHRLELPADGFELANGARLPEVVLAYETYGEMAPDRRNAIFICHTLTGDAHAAHRHHEDDREPGWWDAVIGPGKAIDTDRYFVICANILGGCKGSTGPLSFNPATGKPWAGDFPLVEVKDTVRAHKLLLDQLWDLPELHAVIGGSLGGMLALEWAIAFPDYVKRCVCIAAGAHLEPQALAFDIVARQEIENDPDFFAGRYREQGTNPARGLSRARQIGHVTYLSSESMKLKFGRESQDGEILGERSKFCTDFKVESYLQYQGHKFVERFDANSYLYITRMLDTFDLYREHGSLERAFAGTRARFLVVAISSDWLFPPSQQLAIVKALLAGRKEVSYFAIDSPYGHDAFLIEHEVVAQGLEAFLDGAPEPAGDLTAPARQDVDEVSRLIDPGSHLLDVGSGDGSFMAALHHEKDISGICLDRDFEMIVACMQRGLSALQLDADSALASIPDDAFDCVLLNQTIQQLRSPVNTVQQILRIAPGGIIGFPNFAYWRYRLHLLGSGRLPLSEQLPFEWYETPNIHLVTIADFHALCREKAVRIEAARYLADEALGRLLVRLGRPSLGADRALVKLARPD